MGVNIIHFSTLVNNTLLGAFFIVGYVTYFQAGWYVRLRNLTGGTAGYVARRVGIMVVPLVTAICLQIASNVSGNNSLFYLNIQLFVLAYPLIDEDLGLWEYLARWGCLVFFWFMNHNGSIGINLVAAAVLGLLCIAVRLWTEGVRYNFFANFALAITLSADYWISHPTVTGIKTALYISFFMMMNTYAFFYWNRQHRVRNEQQELTRRINYDTLTNAGSLAMFRDDTAAELARGAEQPFTIAMFDIDHFKMLNDDYGHTGGDFVLSRVAEIIKSALSTDGNQGKLYRVGGEEFAIMMPGYTALTATPLIRECWDSVRRAEFLYKGRSIQCTISLGVSSLQPADTAVATVQSRADESLYLSKQRGRDCITIDGQTEEISNLRTVVTTYTFFTQPIVEIATNAVISNELLLRMYDKGAWTTTTDFDTGIGTSLKMMTRFVEKMPVRSLSMNISREVIIRKDGVFEALAEFMQKRPELATLMVEVRDVQDVDRLQLIARRYKEAGILFGCDDVGVGTSLAVLQDAIEALHVVKIPLKTLRDTLTEEGVHTLIGRIVKLANAHAVRVTCGQVATVEDLELIKSFGIKYGQGDYFSRPVLPRIV